MVDDDESGNVLHVIDLQSGDILQRVHVDMEGYSYVSAILVDVDEIFISGYHEIFISGYHPSKVVVLRYAGSEA